MLFGSLSGTLFIYQGQEIGMTNIDPTTWKLSDLRDVDSLNYYHQLEKDYPGDEELMKRAWQAICDVGRGESSSIALALSLSGPLSSTLVTSTSPKNH